MRADSRAVRGPFPEASDSRASGMGVAAVGVSQPGAARFPARAGSMRPELVSPAAR
ncbi:MAG: hypothetical protein OXG81_07410 [Acidobacteria bacterium]|nr:hypothetical protein [Acidobacteriota bacterium]